MKKGHHKVVIGSVILVALIGLVFVFSGDGGITGLAGGGNNPGCDVTGGPWTCNPAEGTGGGSVTTNTCSGINQQVSSGKNCPEDAINTCQDCLGSKRRVCHATGQSPTQWQLLTLNPQGATNHVSNHMKDFQVSLFHSESDCYRINCENEEQDCANLGAADLFFCGGGFCSTEGNCETCEPCKTFGGVGGDPTPCDSTFPTNNDDCSGGQCGTFGPAKDFCISCAADPDCDECADCEENDDCGFGRCVDNECACVLGQAPNCDATPSPSPSPGACLEWANNGNDATPCDNEGGTDPKCNGGQCGNLVGGGKGFCLTCDSTSTIPCVQDTACDEPFDCGGSPCEGGQCKCTEPSPSPSGSPAPSPCPSPSASPGPGGFAALQTCSIGGGGGRV